MKNKITSLLLALAIAFTVAVTPLPKPEPLPGDEPPVTTDDCASPNGDEKDAENGSGGSDSPDCDGEDKELEG